MPSIGVLVAIIENGRMLLTQRDDFACWCLPGGAVDDGESLEQAAAREAFEETGLQIHLTRLVGMYSQPHWHHGGNYFALFAAEPIGGALRLAASETIDAGFFDRGVLPQPLVWWHQLPIADALDGALGVARVIAGEWPFDQHLTRAEIYALRDQSGLSRRQFWAQHWGRMPLGGEGLGEEQSDILVQLGAGLQLTGDVARDVPSFLVQHGRPDTAQHCGAVAAEARRIAALVGADTNAAEIAGWLHDISVIIPNEQRAVIAEQLGIEVLPEEAIFPMIIHQKLSAILAREIFQIEDAVILSAVGCHTTLKAGATMLDKVLFVADKLAWDQPGHAPFHAQMRAALGRSLDQAALVYLRHLWEQRANLKVLHPWAQAAYFELRHT